MDFIDQLKQFSSRIEKIREQIPTEEATKMSLIVPFFQMLGYDVFNPDEFMPEFTADVGIKKGEKVDYAILKDGSPVVLIEAKWCGENLDNHSSQLFRYFGTTSAKFGILTNGIIYKFYTDLDEPNKMDLSPFLEVDLLNIKDNLIHEIKKFHKTSFDLEKVFSTASELKYSKLVKNFMAEQLKNPSDTFVRLALSDIYAGMKTQNVVDKFRPIIKKAINDFINEMMNEKITLALSANQVETEQLTAPEEDNKEEVAESNIRTSQEEVEAYYIVKSLLVGVIDLNRIYYKDTENYFAVLIDNKVTRWVCRIKLEGKKKFLFLPGDDKTVQKIQIESLDGLYEQKDLIIAAAKRNI